MANLQSTTIADNLNLNKTTENTGSVGNIWLEGGKLYYSYCGELNTFSVGGDLINGFSRAISAGTQNAALSAGPSSPTTLCTEEYNGTAWSAGGAIGYSHPTGVGAGTQNSALAIGGCASPAKSSCTSEYNGSSWSGGGNLITARGLLGAGGTQNATTAMGGDASSFGVKCTEEYNGTSWATGGNMINDSLGTNGSGTQNATLAFGFEIPAFVASACTEEYNGTSWATGGALINVAPNYRSKRGSTAGTQNASWFYHCATGLQTYNGTSWSTSPATANADRSSLNSGCVGTSTCTVIFGGSPSVPSKSTEEFISVCGIFSCNWG